MTPLFQCSIPIRVVSEANQHEHWRVREKRKKGQQSAVLLVLQSKFPNGKHIRPISHISLTRVIATRGHAMDWDNLCGSFKWTIDALAKWLGVNDRELRSVQATQRRGITSAVEIEIY